MVCGIAVSREKKEMEVGYEVYDEISKFSNGVNDSMEDEIDLGKLKRMRRYNMST